MKTLKIIFPDGKEIRLLKNVFIIKDNSEINKIEISGMSLFQKVVKHSYLFECSGFEYVIKKENLIKRNLRKLAIWYFNF